MSRAAARLARVVCFLLAAVTLFGLVQPAGIAEAHRNDESYLYLDVGDTTLSGRVELPYPDLRSVLGFDLEGEPDELLAELEGRLDEMQAYIDANSSVGVDGTVWPLTFDGVELLEDKAVGGDGLGYAIFPFEVELDRDEVPRVLEVTFTPFLAEIDDRNNITLVANDWKRGVVEEEANELLLHSEASPSGTVDLGSSDQWRNFRRSIDLGIDHIRTGPDHIFFVMVLLLPSVLVIVLATWKPVDRFGTALLRVVIVATMFTIAHSITFTLAGLEILPLPPSKLVETLIALSIAAAALHNLKPILGHREWMIAFLFGLFHGMGFAGLVDALDINRSTQLVSLLGRNVGIEIGQLIIIAITFPMLFLLRRTRIYLPIMYAGSVALAALSLTWVYERIFEENVGIDKWVDKVIEWPRSFWVMMVGTGIAGLVYLYERRAGRLLPVYPSSDRGLRRSDDDRPEIDADADPDAEPVSV